MNNPKNYKLIFLFLLIPFILSSSVYSIINQQFNFFLLGWKLISFFILLILYSTNCKLSKFDFTLILYIFVWLLLTLINNINNVFETLKEMLVIISYIFLIEFAISKQKFNSLVFIATFIHIGILLINLVSIFYFPNGIYQTPTNVGVAIYYFLGYKNQITPIIIMSILFLGIYLHLNQKQNKLQKTIIILSFIIIVLNAILLQSSTAIVSVLIILSLYLISNIIPKIANLTTYLICVAFVFVLIVVFREQKFFSFIIEDFLGKELNLTNRTNIWDKSLILITKSPFWGYGVTTLQQIIGDRNAHNYFIQIMLQSGIIGMILLLHCFFVSIKSICLNTKIKHTLIPICLISFLASCINEVYIQMYLFVILCLCYYESEILRVKESSPINEHIKK